MAKTRRTKRTRRIPPDDTVTNHSGINSPGISVISPALRRRRCLQPWLLGDSGGDSEAGRQRLALAMSVAGVCEMAVGRQTEFRLKDGKVVITEKKGLVITLVAGDRVDIAPVSPQPLSPSP